MRILDPNILSLHLVTDSTACGARGLADVVRAAIHGGVTCVQLREKELSTREFVEVARVLKKVCGEAPNRVPLIINDRMDVALAIGADGVHVGQTDMHPEVVRRYLPDAIIGLSVESVSHAMTVRQYGLPVDYLGVGPVFATPTKPDAAMPLDLSGLAAIRKHSSLPLVAIGGIQSANAAEVLEAGADGIAVVSAICSAPNPELAASELTAILRFHCKASRQSP